MAARKEKKNGPDLESIKPADAKFTGWYSRAQAAKKTGKSLSTIKRMIDAGDIVADVDSAGVWWVSPGDVDEMAESAPSEGHAGFVDATTSHIKQLHEHEESLIKLIIDPSSAALKIITSTNQRLTEENRILRERDQANFEAREKLLSEAHERDLASRMVEARERRYEEGFKLLLQHAPKMLEQAMGGASMSKLKPLAGIVVSLDDAMIDMLVPEFMTEAQAAEVKKAKAALLKAGVKPDPKLLADKEAPADETKEAANATSA